MVQTLKGSAFLPRSIHLDLALKSDSFNAENCGFVRFSSTVHLLSLQGAPHCLTSMKREWSQMRCSQEGVCVSENHHHVSKISCALCLGSAAETTALYDAGKPHFTSQAHTSKWFWTSSELISEVSWGREQIEKMTFPQKSFPGWVDLAMSPTRNSYFHLSSHWRMRVKTCLGEGWPKSYYWFSCITAVQSEGDILAGGRRAEGAANTYKPLSWLNLLWSSQ